MSSCEVVVELVYQLLEKFGAVVRDDVLIASGNMDAARAALAELSRDELLDLALEIAQAANSVGDTSALSSSDVASLKALSDLARDVRAETDARPEPPADEQAADILARIRDGGGETAEPPGDASAPLAASATEPVTPGARRPVAVPARHRPRSSTTGQSLVLLASASSDGSGRFEDDDHVAQALVAAADRTRRGRGVDGDLIPVATVDWSGA